MGRRREIAKNIFDILTRSQENAVTFLRAAKNIFDILTNFSRVLFLQILQSSHGHTNQAFSICDHINRRIFERIYCNYKIKRYKKGGKMDNTNQVPMGKCGVCGKEFVTEAELDMHMQSEHPHEYKNMQQNPSSM
jgi:hypothetical protein